MTHLPIENLQIDQYGRILYKGNPSPNGILRADAIQSGDGETIIIVILIF